MPFTSGLGWLCPCLLLAAALAAGTAAGGDELGLEPIELDGRIASLIDQLGSDQYVTRERAQAELERLGLKAFDALHQAQQSDDIEIALRARYLVASMQVSWASESDSAEVRRVLRNYGEENEGGRAARMGRLAAMEGWRGIPALCRLARFEANDALSKRAALFVMDVDPSDDPQQRSRFASAIRGNADNSKRTAAEWLKAYALTLEDPEASLATWDRLAQAEQQTYAQFPEQTNRDVTRDLLRWCANLLRRQGRADEALAVMRRSIHLLDGTRDQLADALDWLMRQQAWSVIDELVDRFPDKVSEDALLLYRLAEARRLQQDRAAAEKLADAALKLAPESARDHVEAGVSLQERGLYDWSEREFRYVMLLGPRGSVTDLYARFLLSEILHDQQQSLAAAEVLQGAVEAMDSDANVQKTVEHMFPREPNGIRSRMHYFFALHYAAANLREKQIEHMDKGIQCDPHDADLLIAMHRLADPAPEWRARTSEYIAAAAGHFRQNIDSLQQLADNPANANQREEAVRQLASANNQLAWLVGNTEGDMDEALRCSRKSLELLPDTAGYLDTLGRCYYAKGDYANAVKHQSRAVELEPRSGQIRRQLELFQQALQQQQRSEPAPAEDPHS